MPTLVATVGAVDANSYITVAAADAIADDTIGTFTWLAVATTTADKERALITATRYLEQLQWIGTRATTTQRLSFPREGLVCGEKVYANDVIPDELAIATFDLAEAFLDNPAVLGAPSKLNGELIPGIPNASLRSARADVIAVEFKDTLAPANQNALSILPHLSSLLGCLCLSRPASAYGPIRVVRS
jgi:hypothetical protein